MDHLSSDSCGEETEEEEEKIELRVDSCLICAQVAATYDLQGNIIKREDSLLREETRKWSSDQLFTVLCRSLEIRVKKLYSPLLQLDHCFVCDTCEGLITSLAEIYTKLEELQDDLRGKVVEAEMLFERDALYEKHCPAYQKFRKDALEAYHKGRNGKQSWTKPRERVTTKPEKNVEETIVAANDSSHDEEEDAQMIPEQKPPSPTRTLRKRSINVCQQNDKSSDSNDEEEETFVPSPAEDEQDDYDDDYELEKPKKRKYTKRKIRASSSSDNDVAKAVPKNQPKPKGKRKLSLFQAAASIATKCSDTVAVRVDPTSRRTAQLKRTTYRGQNSGHMERDPATGSITYTTGYGNRFGSFRTTLIFNQIKRDDGKMGYECTTCFQTFPLFIRSRRQEALFRQHYLTAHSHRYSCRLCPEIPHCSDLKGLLQHLEENHGISTMDRYYNTIGKIKRGYKFRKAKCEICGMPIPEDGRKFHYKAHLRTHMNDEEKREALLLDGRQYKQLSSLPACSSTSVSGSINQCQYCGQFITNSKTGMRHHIRDSHPELEEPSVKPFLCTICGLSLVSITSLEQHTRVKHPDGKIDGPFKCKFPACPGNLSDETSLKDHVEVEHGQSQEARNGVLCMICGKVLAAAWNLKMHGLVHSGKGLTSATFAPRPFHSSPL